MTSVNLFFKRVFQEMKLSLWTLLLGCLVFLFALPIRSAMYISRLHDYERSYQNRAQELVHLYTNDYLLLVIGVVAAVILVFSLFGYLHSKTKTDLYESLPVSRTYLMGTKALAGCFIFLICILSNLLLNTVILISNSFMTTEVFSALVQDVGIHILGFLLLYAVGILSVMLTGTKAGAMVLWLTLYVGGVAAYLIMEGMQDRYFATFYKSNSLIQKISNLSLIRPYIKLIQGNQNQGIQSVVIVLLILIVAIIACLIYKKRPAEGAMKAFLFPKVYFVIKLYISLICCFGFAFFMDVFSSYTKGWFYFGIIAGFVISCSFMEVLQKRDIHAIFHNIRDLAIGGGIVAFVLSVFLFDLFGYDSYLPKESEVLSASVCVQGGISPYSPIYQYKNGKVSYTDPEVYILDHMKLTQIKPVLALAKQGIKDTKSMQSSYNNDIVVIAYHMKDGKKVFREYNIKDINSNNDFVKLYNTNEYKEATSLLQSIPHDILKAVQFIEQGKGNTIFYESNATKVRQIVENYIADEKEMSVSQRSSSQVVGYLMFEYLYQNRINRFDIPVYDCFDRIIQ